MRLDVLRRPLALPGGEPAEPDRPAGLRLIGEAKQLAHQHLGQRVDIEPVSAAEPLYLSRQLAGRCPDLEVMEEQARFELVPTRACTVRRDKRGSR